MHNIIGIIYMALDYYIFTVILSLLLGALVIGVLREHYKVTEYLNQTIIFASIFSIIISAGFISYFF